MLVQILVLLENMFLFFISLSSNQNTSTSRVYEYYCTRMYFSSAVGDNVISTRIFWFHRREENLPRIIIRSFLKIRVDKFPMYKYIESVSLNKLFVNNSLKIPKPSTRLD